MISLSAGLRYEYLDFIFSKDGKKDCDLSRRDNFLTPDISLGFFFNETTMINLSYRTATVKPPYSNITSGLTYTGEHQVEGGNPALRDEKMHDIELFGQWNETDFVRSLDTYAIVKEIYPNDNLQLLMHPVNVNVSELSAYLMWSRSVRRWKPEITLGFTNPWMKYGNDRYDRPMYSYSFKNTMTLPRGFYISANMRGQSSGDIRTNFYPAGR